MSTSTDVEVRATGFDLTRAPDEQWNAEMVKVVAKNVFRGKDITEPQLYYCLAVAEGIGLNPMIGEVYFLPAKSRDAKGPAWTPYIGRNGLVVKAEQAAHYFESDTVHADDRFRMTRKRDGSMEVTHSYTQADRGEIVGAYAFLHDATGRRKPAFFYAKLEEYLPSYDAAWKMDASPWGNQRSAMLEKCAMIGAGRKRLKLGNVLADGEIARYEQMQAVGPGSRPAVVDAANSFDWESLNARPAVLARLRGAVDTMNELVALSWTPARLEMVLSGMTDAELDRTADRIESEIEHARARLSASPVTPGPGDQPPADGPQRPAASASDSEGPENVEEVPDAHVVSDAEHAAALQARLSALEARIAGVEADTEEFSALSAEIDQVTGELEAVENPDQPSLGI